MSDKNLPKVYDAGRLFDSSASTPMIGRGIERLAALQRSTKLVESAQRFRHLWTFTATLMDVRHPANLDIRGVRVEQEILFVHRGHYGRDAHPEVTQLDPGTGGPTTRVFDPAKRREYFSSGQEAKKRAEDLGITFRFYDETYEHAFDENEDDDGEYDYVSLVRFDKIDASPTSEHPLATQWEVRLGFVDEPWEQDCWTRGPITYAHVDNPSQAIAVDTETGRVLWRSAHDDFQIRFEDEKTWLIRTWVPRPGGDEHGRREEETAGLSAQSGRIRWSFPGWPVDLNTAHRVAVFRTGSCVEGRDFDTGASRWFHRLLNESEGLSDRRSDDDSFEQRPEQPQWDDVVQRRNQARLVCSDRHVFASDEVSGRLDAVDLATGALAWSTAVERPIVSMAVDAGRLFVATMAKVHAFSIPV